jgi:hypothetical protein
MDWSKANCIRNLTCRFAQWLHYIVTPNLTLIGSCKSTVVITDTLTLTHVAFWNVLCRSYMEVDISVKMTTRLPDVLEGGQTGGNLGGLSGDLRLARVVFLRGYVYSYTLLVSSILDVQPSSLFTLSL